MAPAEGDRFPILTASLTKEFRGFRALDSLNLRVGRDTFLGFLGPNGAGKTTTIKILTHMLGPTRGQAFLNGVDVARRPKAALAGIGAVVETPEFYPYLTPRQTLMYLGRLRGLPRRGIAARSAEVLSMVDLTDWADQKVGKFSKGMKQRLAIAQAMLGRPGVLILDEPTSGLDPRGIVEIRNVLKALKKERYTVLMSSHVLSEVQEVCDRVALIDHGKLLAEGTVPELLHNRGRRKLEVKFLRPVDDLVLNRIGGMGAVTEVTRLDEDLINIRMNGKEAEQAQLLDEIRGLGPQISSFGEAGNPLEELYMSYIKESR